MRRIIAHLDMDAFFASIEERDNPHFQGKPLIVGADPKDKRGVVSTANYLAREYGISSGMPILKAWEICQKAEKEGKEKCIFLPPDIKKYKSVSVKIERILRNFVPKIEKASIDEFYLDLSFLGSYKKAKDLCKKIKEEIKKQEGLTCSIGIGPNKLVAKIASQLEKPNGLKIILKKEIKEIFDPMPPKILPGVGKKKEEILLNLGIKTIKDLKKLSKNKLEEIFGKFGRELYLKARGIDTSPVIEKKEIKSIGHQITFKRDTLNPKIILRTLKTITDKAFQELKERGFSSFQTIVIIVRFFDFETKNSSKTFTEPILSKKEANIKAVNLLLPFLDRRKNPAKKPIRLIGVRFKNLK